MCASFLCGCGLAISHNQTFFVVATEAFAELKLKCLWACNWSVCGFAITHNRNFFLVGTEVFTELHLKSLWTCKWSALLSCNCTTPSVAIGQWFELQSMYTPSCKYWVLPPDTVLPLQLQPDSGSSCNRCTLRVANTECFRLVLYYPFRCNQIVIRVAIDVHSELQILRFQVFSPSEWFALYMFPFLVNIFLGSYSSFAITPMQSHHSSSCN
jgi:hypothetical protein